MPKTRKGKTIVSFQGETEFSLLAKIVSVRCRLLTYPFFGVYLKSKQQTPFKDKTMALIKTMNHSEYQADCKNRSETSLRHVIEDCKQAIAAMPDNPNAGYYADEIHYCSMELRRRTK